MVRTRRNMTIKQKGSDSKNMTIKKQVERKQKKDRWEV